MRSNWIRLVEKALLLFDIQFTENSTLFKVKTKNRYGQKYKENWEEYMQNCQSPRLTFYKSVKKSYVFEEYLNLSTFQWRKHITKLRCSSHTLQIEKGRHIQQDREERLCDVCSLNEIETEDHLLLRCTLYDFLRTKYNINTNTDCSTIFTDTLPNVLGQFLIDAFALRKDRLDNPLQF